MSTPLLSVFDKADACVEDRIVAAVYQAVAGDPKVQAAFKGQLYLRQILRAPSRNAPAQLIVAPVHQTEHFLPGKTTEGVLRVGLMIVFESYEEDLVPGEPTILTMLAHLKKLVQAAAPFVYDDPVTGVAEPLARHLAWTPLEAVPVYLKPDVLSAFAVGEVAEITFKVARDSRGPLGG